MADEALRQVQLKGKAVPFAPARPGAAKAAISLVCPMSGLCVIFSIEKIVFVCFLLFFLEY